MATLNGVSDEQVDDIAMRMTWRNADEQAKNEVRKLARMVLEVQAMLPPLMESFMNEFGHDDAGKAGEAS